MENLYPPFVDFHNHKKIGGNHIIEVVSMHCDQKKEADFKTIGYHPWWTSEILDSNQLLHLEDTFKQKTCLGIGECGIDKLKGVHLDIQEEIFIQQIELANKLDAPMVIHCVRAFDRVLKCKKRYAKTDWAIHGFVRNAVLAKQVLDAGIFISVAPSRYMKDSFEESLKFMPIDRVFLETDSELSMNIQERYHIFANSKKVDVQILKLQLFNNFTNFYSKKWKYLSG